VWVARNLENCLTQFVGPDGFTALLRRAVVLAGAEIPSLRNARITSEGRLEIIEDPPTRKPDQGEEAIALAAHLLNLLVTLIGEPLTVRIVNDVFLKESGSVVAKSEELNE
jgi:hypothetical protein